MEDLAKMIRNHSSNSTQLNVRPLETTLPKQELLIPEPQNLEPKKSVLRNNNIVKITMLSKWFESNHTSFGNIRQVRLSIRGVDPWETLVFTVLHPSGEISTGGEPARQLRFWLNANISPVLNTTAVTMDVFNNGFFIINQYDDEIYFRSYGTKTGLEVTTCKKVGDYIIPYSFEKLNRKKKQFKIPPTPSDQYFTDKFSDKLDKEALVIQYGQARKCLDQLTSKEDTLKWFLERQIVVADVNHLKTIDNILIWLFS